MTYQQQSSVACLFSNSWTAAVGSQASDLATDRRIQKFQFYAAEYFVANMFDTSIKYIGRLKQALDFSSRSEEWDGWLKRPYDVAIENVDNRIAVLHTPELELCSL